MSAVNLPEWGTWLDVPFAPDEQPVRHRVLFGGRGGAKSWTVANKLVERAMIRRERILCAREFQVSLADSSKKLIEDTIERLGLGPSGSGFFEFREHEIRGRNGSVFVFIGLNGKETAIKSLEGFTLAWVEEAATVGQGSIETLIPTIRQEGSEIWWTYNPRLPTDPIDVLFRGKSGPPPGSVVVEVQWFDNPWFPEVLKQDMAYDLSRDIDKYNHIWLGKYLQHSQAQVFKNWREVSFEAPDDATFRFGADWGYSKDPTVLVRGFIGRWSGEPGDSEVIADSNGRCLFIDYEAYQIACSIDHLPALFAGHDREPGGPRWQNPHNYVGVPGARRYPITADSSRPETIEHMKKRGFKIEGAIKGRDSVEEGITFLQSYDIYVHPRCRHTITELTCYSWKIDKLTGEPGSELADTNNHVIDALRYGLEGVRRSRSSPFEYSSVSDGFEESIRGFMDVFEPNQDHFPRSYR